jgi:sigma-B regulation protein RsbU (phosphoserine phosphatase)
MLKGQLRPLAGRSQDHEPVVHLLLHTLPGRVLVVGAVARVVTWLAQRLFGESAALEAVGTVGTLALLAGVAYFTWRLISLARRQFLWRVRRKLILSFVFVGLVPALLIILFFGLCALFLVDSVSSYVLQARVDRLIEQTRIAAGTAATELARTGSEAEFERHVTRISEMLAPSHPAASVAVLPVNRACASDAPKGGVPARPTYAAAGRWAHVEPPRTLPTWIGCSGFAGVMAYTPGPRSRDSSTGEGAVAAQTRLFVRAVALPDVPTPRFAVVVDLPVDQTMRRRFRDETGVGVGAVSLDGPGPMLGRRPPASSDDSASASGPQGIQLPLPVFLDYTDWPTGRVGAAKLTIDTRVGDMYTRLSATRAGKSNLGQGLLVLIAGVGILFIVIQFVALLMGLGLARSITGSVHELFVGTERVRLGDFSHHIKVRARDQLGELADSFNGMTDRLGQLLVEMAEKKRLEEELRIARDIQMSLLPQHPPSSMPGVSLTALCHPAREVGGDYYDFLPLGPNQLGLLIADVSGKGTSAALYMAELKGLMLSLTQIHRSPRELLIAANRIISANLDSRSFITMTYAVLDLDARTMTWARAGHTPLIHLPAGAGLSHAKVLVPDGLVLGLKLDNGERFAALLEEVSLPLNAGDLFMLFTDGLSEQMNPGEELFGEARLGELIEQHRDLPFDELRERIVREVRAFAAGAAQHDDMTFILLRIEDVPAKEGAREVLGEHAAAV